MTANTTATTTDGFEFPGFPAVGQATAIPNGFFSVVLPRLREASALIGFLYVARLVQEQRGFARFATAEQVWADEGAAAAFTAMTSGRAAVDAGLSRCVEVGALLALDLVGASGEERVYFVNNPGSRRAIARARAGELVLRPETVVRPVEPEARPGIFRLYEENIGTITPLVGERLLAAVDDYPWPWIADAFREAAELNKRNWRYIERMLERWALEGRREGAEGDSFESGRGRGSGASRPARYD